MHTCKLFLLLCPRAASSEQTGTCKLAFLVAALERCRTCRGPHEEFLTDQSADSKRGRPSLNAYAKNYQEASLTPSNQTACLQ